MKTSLRDIKLAGNFPTSIHHLRIMTDKIYKQPSKVYDYIVEYRSEDADNHTRETIFKYLSDKHDNGNYNKIYNRWLA